jgi:hypothetical protein
MLNPLDITPGLITGTVKLGDLPALTDEQIRFGFVPDISKLRAGDLILTKAIDPSAAQRQITDVQTQQYAQRLANAEWTHAAIYVRDWRVIEATPGNNVAHGDMLSWIPSYCLRVRRPTIYNTKTPAEAEMLGMSLALEAALQLGVARYGILAALAIKLRLKPHRPRLLAKHSETNSNSIICSGLYAKCFQISSQASLLTNTMQRHDEPITPRLLSEISTLEDVPIGWAKLVN